MCYCWCFSTCNVAVHTVIGKIHYCHPIRWKMGAWFKCTLYIFCVKFPQVLWSVVFSCLVPISGSQESLKKQQSEVSFQVFFLFLCWVCINWRFLVLLWCVNVIELFWSAFLFQEEVRGSVRLVKPFIHCVCVCVCLCVHSSCSANLGTSDLPWEHRNCRRPGEKPDFCMKSIWYHSLCFL